MCRGKPPEWDTGAASDVQCFVSECASSAVGADKTSRPLLRLEQPDPVEHVIESDFRAARGCSSGILVGIGKWETDITILVFFGLCSSSVDLSTTGPGNGRQRHTKAMSTGVWTQRREAAGCSFAPSLSGWTNTRTGTLSD